MAKRLLIPLSNARDLLNTDSPFIFAINKPLHKMSNNLLKGKRG